MSEQITKIENEFGQQMVNQTADIVVKDSRDIIFKKEQLVSPGMVGSPLEAVAPFKTFKHPRLGEVTRADVKAKVGYSRPDLPRYATGALLQSITAEYGSLTATAGVGVGYAVEQQDGVKAGWLDEYGAEGKAGPARPFMGVSDRALKLATDRCEKLAGKMVAAFENVTIQPGITIQV